MRLAILTFESPQSDAIVARVLAERSDEVCGIVYGSSLIPRRTAWQSVRHVLRCCAPEFLAWKATEAVVTRLAVVKCRLLGRTPAVNPLHVMTSVAGVELVGTSDVNGADTVAVLRGWKPDVVISIYFNQLIRAPVFAICPVINVHGGRLPEGRGLFPYFWTLVHGDTTAGAAVHWMDEQFDTGDLLYDAQFPISADDTVHSLAWRCANVAAELLIESLDAIARGDPPRRPQDHSKARYMSWPHSRDVRRLWQQGRRFGSVRQIWQRTVGTSSPLPPPTSQRLSSSP